MKPIVSTIAAVAVLIISTTALADEVADGKALFTSLGCVACHSVDGSRLVGPSMKGLYGKTEQVTAGPGGAVSNVVVDDKYITDSIKNPMAQITAGYPPAMVVAKAPTDAEIAKLIAYIKSLK